MPEAVRLVVWDLDDTFWRGTLTEGGIKEYVQEHHDIIIALAKRGIISSICSKNDPAAVLPILRDSGILDYIVFPSISWEPKGLRLAALIETVQLRPATVLFVDDNPTVRAEARSVVPDLQIEDETFIARMLSDPRFKGKDDQDLSRLKQYKLLEDKKRDEEQAVGGSEEFLRGCDARVYIEYDVESHLDRAIELINRTNQLNFTKNRLPEDIDKAREMLRADVNSYSRQSGLIHVRDKYGDYGFVGFFMTKSGRREDATGLASSTFIHYCFSCRTLGMYVEQWVYEHLRRPQLNVVGEVLTDLSVPRKVDWIRLVTSLDGDVPSQHETVTPRFVLMGGCETNAIAVYLNAYAPEVHVHGTFTTGGLFVRINSALVLESIFTRTPAAFEAEAQALDLPVNLLAFNPFEGAPEGSVFVVNCSLDSTRMGNLYVHKDRGWQVWLDFAWTGTVNMLRLSEAELVEKLDATPSLKPAQRAHVLRAAAHMRANYVPGRQLTDAERVSAMRELIARIPEGSKLVIVADHDEQRVSVGVLKVPSLTRYGEVMRDLASEYPHVGFASYSEAVRNHDDIQMGAGNHLSREVYLRFVHRIIEVAKALPPKRADAGAPVRDDALVLAPTGT